MLSPSLLSLLSSRSLIALPLVTFPLSIWRIVYRNLHHYDAIRSPTFHPLAVHREHLSSFYLDAQSSQVISSKRKLLAKMRWRWENTSSHGFSQTARRTSQRYVGYLYTVSKTTKVSLGKRARERNFTLKTFEENVDFWRNLHNFVIKALSYDRHDLIY